MRLSRAQVGSVASLLALAACGRSAPERETGAPPPPETAAAAVTTGAKAPGGAAMATTAKAKVGQPAPDFHAKDQDGRERTLAEFRGKRIVLWFYPKADTGG